MIQTRVFDQLDKIKVVTKTLEKLFKDISETVTTENSSLTLFQLLFWLKTFSDSTSEFRKVFPIEEKYAYAYVDKIDSNLREVALTHKKLCETLSTFYTTIQKELKKEGKEVKSLVCAVETYIVEEYKATEDEISNNFKGKSIKGDYKDGYIGYEYFISQKNAKNPSIYTIANDMANFLIRLVSEKVMDDPETVKMLLRANAIDHD